jgi:purine-binding chemotaxis protein CheW
VVALRAGGVEFGIPVGQVRAVLRPGAVARIPFPAPGVRGVTSVQGQLLPVLDLGDRLGLAAVTPPGRFVVVEAAGTEVVLWVDAVLDLLDTSEPIAPPEEAALALEPTHLLGVVSPAPDRLVAVLDLSSVLSLPYPTGETAP